MFNLCAALGVFGGSLFYFRFASETTDLYSYSLHFIAALLEINI